MRLSGGKRSTGTIIAVFVAMLLAILLLVSGYHQFLADGVTNDDALRVMRKNPVRDYLADVKQLQERQLDVLKAKLLNKPFQSTGNLTVHFLDVGHGDSILIVTPSGATILIDGGYEDQGRYILDYLRGLGFNYLDYAIASHPDADHIGGLDFVLKKLAFVNKVLDNGKGPADANPSDLRTYRSYRRVSLEQGGYATVRKDMVLPIDDNVQLDILVPFDKKKYFNSTNDNSLIVKLVYGKVSFLFTGDCEWACEERLLKKDIQATIMKVGHHGADDATSQAFLDSVRPEVAIISTGDFESFGHPHEAVLRRLQENGIEIHRTDLEGNIIVTTDGSGFTVETLSREAAARREGDLWHAAEKAGATVAEAGNESS